MKGFLDNGSTVLDKTIQPYTGPQGFFLVGGGGVIKDSVYEPPHPTTMVKLRNSITTAEEVVTERHASVWDEF